jgi:hypothetical protein
VNEKEIFIEKLTEQLSSHFLSYDNHTNAPTVLRCDSYRHVIDILEDLDYNFLGITTPPYNPYGEEFNFAFVMEDKQNDYDILWHHCSRKWLNKIAESLGISHRF